MQEKSYFDTRSAKTLEKIEKLMNELPYFAENFFIGIENRTTPLTRLNYAYDLRIFFEFMRENNPCFAAYNMRDIPLSILDEIKALDIEEYLEYLKLYEKDGKTYTNTEKGLARKLASLKTFYNYFFRKELIFTNPPALVSAPKLHEKNIIRLDVDEVARLLDHVESGEKLTKRQQTFHEKTKIRDLALLTLFLGTGIRVSECVGLDMTDVDLDNNGIRIIRKGGNEVVVYFSDEVHDALIPYLEERKNITAHPGHENALFLSLQPCFGGEDGYFLLHHRRDGRLRPPRA